MTFFHRFSASMFLPNRRKHSTDPNATLKSQATDHGLTTMHQLMHSLWHHWHPTPPNSHLKSGAPKGDSSAEMFLFGHYTFNSYSPTIWTILGFGVSMANSGTWLPMRSIQNEVPNSHWRAVALVSFIVNQRHMATEIPNLFQKKNISTSGSPHGKPMLSYYPPAILSISMTQIWHKWKSSQPNILSRRARPVVPVWGCCRCSERSHGETTVVYLLVRM